MKKFSAISLLGCLFLACQSANATVGEQLDYEYYDVYATPNQSLLTTLNQASPIHESGHTFHGHTHWNVKWHFRWQEASSHASCRIIQVQTELTAKIQLPHLLHPTAQQERQFDQYVSALRVHELGHVENGRQAALEIDQGILNLPEMENCAALESAANALGHRILRQYNDKDEQYDAATDHGKTQGASLRN